MTVLAHSARAEVSVLASAGLFQVTSNAAAAVVVVVATIAVGAAGLAAVGSFLLGARLGGSMSLAVSCVALYCGLSAGAVALFRRGVRR